MEREKNVAVNSNRYRIASRVVVNLNYKISYYIISTDLVVQM